MPSTRRVITAGIQTALLLLLIAPSTEAQAPQVRPDQQAVLDRISEGSLKAALSFLASDELGGRGTPSKGLDVAAEYIVARLRGAGLEPAAGGSYLQEVPLAIVQTQRGRRTTTPDRVQGGTDYEPARAFNVVGLLRGSDPALADTYVILSAHYDHVGIRAGAGPDSIYNGANDDGSGTVSVVEIAEAMAVSGYRPKRSILFALWCGEESGLVGSRFYGSHPLVPVEKTVAMVNLEQVGRTDGDGGDQTGRASFTGFDYSEVPDYYRRAGLATGIEVFRHEQNSDPFFTRSDNAALALQGIPSHAMCVAFEYPDYHRAGDHWDLIDYPNLAATTRMVALGTMLIAESPEAPGWNAENERTARFIEAWERLQPPPR